MKIIIIIIIMIIVLQITIMKCGLEVFFGGFLRISVIGCISVFLVTVNLVSARTRP